AGIVDGPDHGLLVEAMSRAQYLVRQEIRPDTERIDIEPADVADGVSDDQAGAHARVEPSQLKERVVVETSDDALGLNPLFADGVGQLLHETPIRAKELRLDVQLDLPAAEVDHFRERGHALAGEGRTEPAADVQLAHLFVGELVQAARDTGHALEVAV